MWLMLKKENAALECDRADFLITAQVPLNSFLKHLSSKWGLTKKRVPPGVPGNNSLNHMKVHMTQRYDDDKTTGRRKGGLFERVASLTKPLTRAKTVRALVIYRSLLNQPFCLEVLN